MKGLIDAIFLTFIENVKLIGGMLREFDRKKSALRALSHDSAEMVSLCGTDPGH